MNYITNNYSPGFLNLELNSKAKNIGANIVNEPQKFKIIISESVMRKVDYLHNRFPNLEWGGFMFLESNNASEIENLIYTTKDIYPLDLGTGSFTSYTQDEAFCKFMVDNLEYMDYKLALFHTHHSMGAFFSGTDTDTLHENIDTMNSVISIVGDVRNTWKAKYGFKVKNKLSYKLNNMSSITYNLNNEMIEANTHCKDEKDYERYEISHVIYESEFEYPEMDTLDTEFIKLADKISKNKQTQKNLFTSEPNVALLNNPFGGPTRIEIGPDESNYDPIIELIVEDKTGETIEIFERSFDILVKALSLDFNLNTKFNTQSYKKWFSLLNSITVRSGRDIHRNYAEAVYKKIIEEIDKSVSWEELEYFASDLSSIVDSLPGRLIEHPLVKVLVELDLKIMEEIYENDRNEEEGDDIVPDVNDLPF